MFKKRVIDGFFTKMVQLYEYVQLSTNVETLYYKFWLWNVSCYLTIKTKKYSN